MQKIDVKQLAQIKSRMEVDLVDVRMPTEFRQVHIRGARNYPLDSLDPQAITKSRSGGSGEPIYLICKSGGRSSKALQKFMDAGVENVIEVEGGTSAWVNAGLPVNRGKKAMSLECQVRTLVGFLTLLGALLGLLVHPYLIVIPAMMGAGLMFSGITDSCAMGMMLSKMPWNQAAPPESCAA
jgi:rhodanese-related sulfurtransferase